MIGEGCKFTQKVCKPAHKGHTMNFRLGELFCGPGGLGLAAKRARVTDADGKPFTISHAWANDYDKNTCETYRRNICPDSPNSVVREDVRQFMPETAVQN